MWSRLLSTLFAVYSGVLTADINIRQRVYFPPLFNYVSVVLCCGYVVAGDLIGGFAGFYMLITMACVTAMGLTAVSAYYSVQASRKLSRTPQKERKEFNAATGNYKIHLRLLSRTLFAASHYLTPAAVLFAARGLDGVSIVTAIVITKTIAESLIERPFRAIYIDILRARNRELWPLLRFK